MKKIIHILALFFIIFSCSQQNSESTIAKNKISVSNTFVERVEPPNWWVGFKDNTLQLLVKEDSIGTSKPEILYQGISIKKVSKGTSLNYLFIDLNISEAEFSARKAAWQQPALKAKRGILYKYAKTVSTASQGCVTDEF